MTSAAPAVARCRTRKRSGFLLPFVLVALLLVTAISGAAGLGAWRAMRAARLAWNGERAAQAADEALAMTAASWDAEAFAERPIGARWRTVVLTRDGATVEVSAVRTAPLTVVVEATSRSRVSGSPDTAGRRIARALALEAPRFPLPAVLTALGDVRVTGTANIDGRDLAASSDGCGALRDTASVAPLIGADVQASASTMLSGDMAVRSPGGGGALAEHRATFDAAWNVTVERTRQRQVVSAAPLGTGRGWSARYVTSSDSAGRRVVLSGVSSHDGLLLVDGNLVVQGVLRLRGLLAVSGSLDVTAGELDVEGGVVVRDGNSRGSHAGSGTRIRYSPCSVRRALASVARPGFARYGMWVAR